MNPTWTQFSWENSSRVWELRFCRCEHFHVVVLCFKGCHLLLGVDNRSHPWAAAGIAQEGGKTAWTSKNVLFISAPKTHTFSRFSRCFRLKFMGAAAPACPSPSPALGAYGRVQSRCMIKASVLKIDKIQKIQIGMDVSTCWCTWTMYTYHQSAQSCPVCSTFTNLLCLILLICEVVRKWISICLTHVRDWRQWFVIAQWVKLFAPNQYMYVCLQWTP